MRKRQRIRRKPQKTTTNAPVTPTHTETSSTSTQSGGQHQSSAEQILTEQRTRGNQAVLRMLNGGTLQREGPDDDTFDPNRIVNGVRLGSKADSNSNPNTYYGAINIIQACTKSLKGHSLEVFPGWGGSYYYIPTYFRSAAMGRDYIMSITDAPSELSGETANNYMAHGLQQVQPLLSRIKKVSPEDGSAWIQNTFTKQYQSTLVSIANRSARKEVDNAAERLRLEGGVLSGMTQQQAQMLKAVKFGFSTFDQTKKIIEAAEATHGYDPSSSLKSQFSKVLKGDPPAALTQDVANLDTPSALSHSVTILKTIEAVWKISDPEQRKKFARENYPNTFAQGVDIAKFSVELLEVTVGVFSAIGAIAAKLSPAYKHLVPQILGTSSSVMSAIGKVAGALQILYGVTVLMSSDKESDKRGALLDIGLGTAAVTGSGPMAVGVLWAAAQVEFFGEAAIGFQKGFQKVYSTGPAFRSMQKVANNQLAPEARKLAAATLLLEQMEPTYGPVQNYEATPYGAMENQVSLAAVGTLIKMEQFLKVCTDPSFTWYISTRWHKMGHPANTPEIKNTFSPYIDKVKDAQKNYDPQKAMELAKDVMTDVANLLGRYEEIAKAHRNKANEGSWFFGGREDN